MNKLLKAKHGQLFILLFGIPFLLLLLNIYVEFSNYDTKIHREQSSFNFESLFHLSRLLAVVVFFGWIWSIAIGFQNRIPGNIQMKVNKFKALFFLSILIILVFTGFVLFELDHLLPNNTGLILILYATSLLVGLFVITCILHTIYFVAKTLKTVELQRPVAFGEFATEFFLILFLPIGIWILQPRINKMNLRFDKS